MTKQCTYKKALELLQGLETAAKNIHNLQSTKQEPVQVHKVTPGQSSGVQTAGVAMQRLFQMWEHNSFSLHCLFKGARCHNCGKVGHIRKTCMKPKNPVGGWQSSITERQECEEPEVEQDSIQNEYPLCCLSDAVHSKLINVDVVVDGKSLMMELEQLYHWYQRVHTRSIGLTGSCRSARHD